MSWLDVAHYKTKRYIGKMKKTHAHLKGTLPFLNIQCMNEMTHV